MPDEKERAQLDRLKKLMPVIAVVMSVGTYFIILSAGHSTDKALLVAGIMLTFVMSMWVLRVLLGVKGFVVGLVVLFLITWRLQNSDWFQNLLP